MQVKPAPTRKRRDRREQTNEVSVRTRVALGIALIALPAWTMLTGAAQIGPPAPQTTTLRAPALTAAPATAAPQSLGEAFAAAIALQGAIVVHDWTEAARQLTLLEAGKLTTPITRTEQLHLAQVTPLIDSLGTSIKLRDARLANEQSYRLSATLLAALDDRLPAGGGGGGGGATQAQPAPALASSQHMRSAATAAAQAQASLLAGDATSARTHLDIVRDQLRLAAASTQSPALKTAIVNLDKRRWRVVAALGNPPVAYRNGLQLASGLLHTMHLVGRYELRRVILPAGGGAGGGGGGGGTKSPVLQDVPEPNTAHNGHQRPGKQVAMEQTPYGKRQ